MSLPRVAFITNLCPHYRRPLFERLAASLPVTFYFFSRGEEGYLGSGIAHEPGAFPVRDVRRVSILGHPLLTGLAGDLNAQNYDVVIKCINGRLMTPYTYSLARLQRLPFVLWTGLWHHPEILMHRLTQPLVKRLYRGADSIVAYGDHVKRYTTGIPGVDESKVYVAGQAVDMARFSTAVPSGDSSLRVVFVGRLEAQKGVLDLLDAFSAVDEPGARLCFAGTGALEPVVRERARRDQRIEVLGHVPQTDLPAELAAARCLVLPSVTTRNFREPWGLVANEAMASGTPVVATDAVGAVAGGLVRNGRNGLVVPERAPRALAAAIGALLGDAQLARSLGERARADVAAFSYARMAQAFVDAIRHALPARGREFDRAAKAGD